MHAFCLFVDGAEMTVLRDALNSLPDDYYDPALADSLRERLRTGFDIDARWTVELLKAMGLGSYKDHPQG